MYECFIQLERSVSIGFYSMVSMYAINKCVYGIGGGRLD